jgi:hypothetical protein
MWRIKTVLRTNNCAQLEAPSGFRSEFAFDLFKWSAEFLDPLQKIPVGKPAAHRAWLNPHYVRDPANRWLRATPQLKAVENRLALALSFFVTFEYLGVSAS